MQTTKNTKELHLAGIFPERKGLGHSSYTSLENALKNIERKIADAARSNDLVFTPECTFMDLSENGPRITFTESGELKTEKEVFGFLERMMAIAHHGSVNLFLGTFVEDMVIDGYSVISNTALHVDPNRNITPIRKTVHGGYVVILPYSSQEGSFILEEGSNSQNLKIKAAVEQHIQENIKRRIIEMGGLKVLPIICAELDYGIERYKWSDIDLVLQMSYNGRRYNLEAGAITNLDNAHAFSGLREASEGGGKMALRIIREDLQYVLKKNGAFATIDSLRFQGAIMHPYSDKKIQNYEVNSNGVFGTVTLDS